MSIRVNLFKDIKVGDSASFSQTVRAQDVLAFARLSGDINPIHLNDGFAAKTGFKKRIVHGMYLAALVSRLIGTKLPGKHALLVKTTLEFKKPAYVGYRLSIRGEVIHKSQASRLLEISVTIYRQKEILVGGSVYVRVMQ